MQLLRSRPSIALAQGSLETQLPQPTTAAAGSAIDVQLFPLAGRTQMRSPKQKIQNLHVAQASPHCTSYRGMQMVFPPKCRNYVTDRQPKALTCVGSRKPNSLKRMHPRLSHAAAQSELTAPAATGEGMQKQCIVPLKTTVILWKDSPYKSSCGPFALTSCVAKPIERMIHNRLYYLAKNQDWLCPEQAVFKAIQPCEDQIMRVKQTISNVYQVKKPCEQS